MFDYRLFFSGSTLDSTPRERRPLLGHNAERVYRLSTNRRDRRDRERR